MKFCSYLILRIYIAFIAPNRKVVLAKLGSRSKRLSSLLSSLSFEELATSLENIVYNSAIRSAARPEFLIKPKYLCNILLL
jgi:hypothetical protein